MQFPTISSRWCQNAVNGLYNSTCEFTVQAHSEKIATLTATTFKANIQAQDKAAGNLNFAV